MRALAWSAPLALLFLGTCAFPKLETGEVCGLLEHGPSDCETCMEERCCAEGSACRKDRDCFALQQCLATCASGDSLCPTLCAEQHGANAVSAELSQCRTSRCAETCNTCTGTHHKVLATCDDCMRAECCEVATDCAADPDCAAVVACAAGCETPGCRDVCVSEFPDAAAAFDDLSDCERDTCRVECAWGENWECVDAYDLLVPEAETGTFTLRIFSLLGLPKGSVTARACALTDLECAEPVAETKTDSFGLAYLTVPLAPRGFLGYVELSGSDIGTAILKLNAPLVGDLQVSHTVGAWEDTVAFMEAAGVSIDSSRGALLINGLDCDQTLAEGLQFEIDDADAQSSAFYSANGAIAPDATSSSFLQPAGWLNVKPGLVGVAIRREETGEIVARDTIVIREQTVSVSFMYPSAQAR